MSDLFWRRRREKCAADETHLTQLLQSQCFERISAHCAVVAVPPARYSHWRGCAGTIETQIELEADQPGAAEESKCDSVVVTDLAGVVGAAGEDR